MLLAWGLLTVILLYYRSFTMREAASISIPKFRIRQEKWEAGFACLTVIVKRSKAIMQSMMNITVQMYPCSEGTDTGSPAL